MRPYFVSPIPFNEMVESKGRKNNISDDDDYDDYDDKFFFQTREARGKSITEAFRVICYEKETMHP